MFVKDNSLQSLKEYFNKRLASLYEYNAIRQFVKAAVCTRMNIDQSDWILQSDLQFSESDLLYFRSLVKRLQSGEPMQYVLGEVEFYGLRLSVDERALIPRPETEELVDWVCSSMEAGANSRVIDLCAGSGCIALALASQMSKARVTAVELSPEAVELIKENAQKCNLEIEIANWDVLDAGNYSSLSEVDTIVSNPPYVMEKDKLEMEEMVLDHEPHMALFVEDSDPLLFYREIGKNAIAVLKNEGFVFFEIHESYGKDLITLLQELGFVNIDLRKDLQGKDRMIRAQKLVSHHE